MQAQQSDAKCDSLIAAATVDHVESGLFLSVQRVDAGMLSAEAAAEMVLEIGSAFTPPKPFKLSVFAGPSLMRGLRSRNDTAVALRPPTLTGVYRALLTRERQAPPVSIVRFSLMTGFDSAAVDAIQAAVLGGGAFAALDSVPIEVTFATDSTLGARRLVSATFPRVAVHDATLKPGSPAPATPAARTDDGTGPVILRFVVGRDGSPQPGTAEVVRASSLDLLRASLAVLGDQQFAPATVRGCPVSQRVDMPFVFASPR